MTAKTFITDTDMNVIAETLDDARLNRQRSDVSQILKALLNPTDDDDHPGVKMWRGNERFLIKYGMTICMEWQSRGNNDETMAKVMQYRSVFHDDSDVAPEWWGSDEVINSHRSYLLRSMPSHYRPLWPNLADDLPIFYPRSPERSQTTTKRKERDKLIRRAWRAKAKAEAAVQAAHDAAMVAGLDPDTMEAIPDDELVLETIGTPDEDLLEL